MDEDKDFKELLAALTSANSKIARHMKELRESRMNPAKIRDATIAWIAAGADFEFTDAESGALAWDEQQEEAEKAAAAAGDDEDQDLCGALGYNVHPWRPLGRRPPTTGR